MLVVEHIMNTQKVIIVSPKGVLNMFVIQEPCALFA